jgi:hypothetical protein
MVGEKMVTTGQSRVTGVDAGMRQREISGFMHQPRAYDLHRFPLATKAFTVATRSLFYQKIEVDFDFCC